MHYSRVICLASILDLIGMDFSKDTDVSLSVKDFISSYPLYPGLELSQFLGGSLWCWGVVVVGPLLFEEGIRAHCSKHTLQ